MVLTAGDFSVEKDGRVRLNPVSLATFKERKDGTHPDITTLRADVAWITFDRPVSSFSEIAYRKIVEAELNGKVVICNNRRKKARDEDLLVRIGTDKQPAVVYYREDTHQIWTNDVVYLYDHRAKPKPHTVTGKGLRMELQTEGPPAAAAANNRQPARKQQRESITGVKWIALNAGVVMVIQLDGSSGLLGPGQAPAPPPSKGEEAKPRDPCELTITTPGTFRYEVNKDHDLARFDEAKPGLSQPLKMEPDVEVVRKHLTDGKRDHLTCQHLTLRLRRKDANDPKAPKKSDATGEGAEVETAEATAPSPGRFVTLTSETDGLVVKEANYFFHDALKQKTTVRAASGPVKVTYKVDTNVEARELEIQVVKPPAPLARS
jgi:hypothetical protein